jgi:hypothetical protein
MSSSKVQVGSRVRVSLNVNHQQGRTGVVLQLQDVGEDSSDRRWLVRFDWPLGGMGNYGEVSEENLELLQNIPDKGDLPL